MKSYCTKADPQTHLTDKRRNYKKEKFNTTQGFLGGSLVKNLPAMQEMWVQSIGGEDALEKEMATHCNIPAWETLWAEEPGGCGPRSCNRT